LPIAGLRDADRAAGGEDEVALGLAVELVDDEAERLALPQANGLGA
jgi:hypothetical protein